MHQSTDTAVRVKISKCIRSKYKGLKYIQNQCLLEIGLLLKRAKFHLELTVLNMIHTLTLHLLLETARAEVDSE